MYSQKTREHFLHPHNVGELEDADAVGRAHNEITGDRVVLTLKIDGAKIIKARFKAYGCGAAIASASMLTDLIQGQTIDTIKDITNANIADALEDFPENKKYCSLLAEEVLNNALENYKKGKKYVQTN